MDRRHTSEEVRSALGPLASLASKSAKARRKVAAGSWQHAMLGENIEALRVATALLEAATGSAGRPRRMGFTPAQLRAALRALASMTARTEKSRGKFAPGTSHYALQRNRLEALRTAKAFVRAALDAAS